MSVAMIVYLILSVILLGATVVLLRLSRNRRIDRKNSSPLSYVFYLVGVAPGLWITWLVWWEDVMFAEKVVMTLAIAAWLFMIVLLSHWTDWRTRNLLARMLGTLAVAAVIYVVGFTTWIQINRIFTF